MTMAIKQQPEQSHVGQGTINAIAAQASSRAMSVSKVYTQPTSSIDALPAGEAQRLEAKCALAYAIDRLPTGERLVLELMYYEGLTVTEAALLLGLQAFEARQSHADGLDRLQISLQEIRLEKIVARRKAIEESVFRVPSEPLADAFLKRAGRHVLTRLLEDDCAAFD